jgi:hypothetical protein
MRINKLLGLSPILLCIAAAPGTETAQANASAAQPAAEVAAANAAPKADDPKICKNLPESGTRLPNRACLTKREWDQLNKELEQDR